MTNAENINSLSKLLSLELDIKFENHEKKLNSWGQVDNWAKISSNTELFLEVETSQKHPNTNVLKIWPHLEENNEIRIFLIQAFFPNSPGLTSNRGRLCDWVAEKMKRELKDRFGYAKIIVSNDTILEKDNLTKALNSFKNIA